MFPVIAAIPCMLGVARNIYVFHFLSLSLLIFLLEFLTPSKLLTERF